MVMKAVTKRTLPLLLRENLRSLPCAGQRAIAGLATFGGMPLKQFSARARPQRRLFSLASSRVIAKISQGAHS
jgi:hypothetical protein